mgnify:CR=1 FL=1
MNIIIVGCGRIGSTLVEELSGENHDISIMSCILLGLRR